MGDPARLRATATALAVRVLLLPANAVGDGPTCAGYLQVPAAQATWYTVGSPQCSLPVAPGDFVTAVAAPDFQGSGACGRCLQVTGPLGSVLVLVVDQCPGCVAGHLDLGADAFAQVAAPTDGIADISYESTECPVVGPIHIYFSPAGNPYYAQVQIRNHRYGVKSVEAYADGSWVSLPRTADNYFEFNRSELVPNPLDLRVTDIHDDVLVESGVHVAANSEVTGSGQFTPCPEPHPVASATALLATASLCHRRRIARKRAQPDPAT